MFGVGAAFGVWGLISLGVAGIVSAIYLALAIEQRLIPSPSHYSQLALFLMGICVVFAAYDGLQDVVAESGVNEPSLIFVIGGFVLMPMIGLFGFAMTCCAAASKTASHGMLMYFATEPSRMNQDIF